MDRVISEMFKPFSTTGIGSLPHRDPDEACRLIFNSFDIPFWPQLPNRTFREFMIPQYSEGMPFLRMDEHRNAVWVERSGSDELDRFYESWNDETRIAISEDCAAGLHAFNRASRLRSLKYVKGHVTGPLTFTLGLKDGEGKPVFYDEELREISLMLLKAKVRWQLDFLKSCAEKVILFIDEPILSALGTSSYLGVSGDEALRLLQETVQAVRAADGIAGIHCCGNADWPLVIRSGADIINFDAFDYIDTIAIYHEELRAFLEQGGFLAWGIVPTSDAIQNEDPATVLERLDRGITAMSSNIPEQLILSRMLITPSCGTGSRTVDETIKIFQIVMRLKEAKT